MPTPFGNYLLGVRDALGLTREEAAARAGCTPIMLTRYEQGADFPGRQALARLAAIYQVSVAELRTQWKRLATVSLASHEQVYSKPIGDPDPAAFGTVDHSPVYGRIGRDDLRFGSYADSIRQPDQDRWLLKMRRYGG